MVPARTVDNNIPLRLSDFTVTKIDQSSLSLLPVVPFWQKPGEYSNFQVPSIQDVLLTKGFESAQFQLPVTGHLLY